MAQRVEYAFFPGVRDETLWPTVNKVLGQVRRSQWQARDLRDWLKDAGLWQKDEAPALLGFLDIQQAPQVALGPWAESVFATKDDAAARDLLFKRLCDENILLVKYVLEALDVDGGGRLHSTSELHRMLTSYVYPGQHIGRVAFEAWVKWIVASGRVKLIGIRWGLTDLGKQAVPRLRAVDADEFLEDEAAPPRTTPAAATAPAVAVSPPAAAPTPAADDEDLPDAPPEAEPVDERTFAAYEAKLEEPAPPPSAPREVAAVREATAVRESTGPRPAPVTARAPAATTVTAPDANAECRKPPLEPGQIVAALKQWAVEHGVTGGSLLAAYGLESRLAQQEPARHLFVAALLARLSTQPDAAALAELLQERAGGWGPVALLLERPEALVECLARWNLAGSEPDAQRLRAVLLEATLGGRALKAQADLPKQLAETATADVLLTTVGRGLMRSASLTAQFWLVRELVCAGVWTQPCATEVASVPSRPVRLMAYRLRLLDSHFAPTLAAHLTVARRLAGLLPAGSVEAAAFEALAPLDHLRLDCPLVVPCSTTCAATAK